MPRLEALIAIVSLGIAILVGFGIYHLVYTAPKVQQVHQAANCPKVPDLKEIMVASVQINTGDAIADSVTYEKWPESALRKDFYVKNQITAEELKSLIARRVINPGEPVAHNSVVDRKSRGVLSALLGEGMRAVSINIDPASGMAGLLSPGDVVDVLSAPNTPGKEKEEANQTILCGVRILALDQHLAPLIGDAASKKTPEVLQPPKSVTLEVTPQQASILSSAVKTGTISLSLHSTNDGQNICTTPEPPVVKPMEQIKIFRGDDVQTVPQPARQ